MRNYGIMQGRLTPPKGRGIQFFPFENWREEFYAASEIGLQEIEFIFDQEEYEKNPLWSIEGVKELICIMEKTGVKVNAVCFDYFMRVPFYKETQQKVTKVREENKDVLLHVIRSMKQAGIPLIEIPLVDHSSLKSDQERDLFRDFLLEIEKEALKIYPEIKFGLETDLGPGEFIEYIETFHSDRIGANYDSGNSSGIGYDLYEEVVSLGGKIFNIHIKDRVYQGTTVALGTGSADFDRLFQGLQKIGYQGTFILQAARGEEGKEKQNIVSQMTFLKKYVADYGL